MAKSTTAAAEMALPRHPTPPEATAPPLSGAQLAAMEQELAAARSIAGRGRAHGRPSPSPAVATTADAGDFPPTQGTDTATAGAALTVSTSADDRAQTAVPQPRLLPSGTFLLPAAPFRGIEGLGTDSARAKDGQCASCGCADFERTEHVRLAVGYLDGQRFGPVFRCLRCGEVRNAREVLARADILRQNEAMRTRRG